MMEKLKTSINKVSRMECNGNIQKDQQKEKIIKNEHKNRHQ